MSSHKLFSRRLLREMLFIAVLFGFLLLNLASGEDNGLLTKEDAEITDDHYTEILTEENLIIAENVDSNTISFEETTTTFEKEVSDTPLEEHGNIVETKDGPVLGVTLKSSNNKNVNAYYGIPYAIPPIGELRFQPPQKNKPHGILKEALKPSPICYQEINDDMRGIMREMLSRPWSEDCLTLNIWTPNPKPKNAPVLVNIHGGAFILGSSTMFSDGVIMATEGFITVSMNYRLGVYGFFNLGQSEAPGNVGLMDQNLALRWVKENIGAFGGDPDGITLIGASAGSASVGFHLLSKRSTGLFNRAIMMGGAPTNSWAITEPESSIKKAKELLQDLGCPLDNTTLALNCIQKKDPDDILEASRTKALLSDHFIPTVDGDFLTEHPSVSVEAGRFNPGDVLVGSAADEGAVFMFMGQRNVLKTNDARLFRKYFLNVIKGARADLSDLQLKALDIIYTNWTNPDDPIMLRDSAKDLYGDGLFVCNINEFAEKLSRAGNTVFRYVYNHKVSLPMMMMPDWMGASHGSDSLPIIGADSLSSLLKFEDTIVYKRFRSHVINFARNGDPNLSKGEYAEESNWPTYRSGQYNLFGKTSSIQRGPRSQECAVWLRLIPLLADENKC